MPESDIDESTTLESPIQEVKPKNYLNELRDVVYERLVDYGADNFFPMWTHIRALMSLRHQHDTGVNLNKGNRVITREQCERCLTYIDEILPPISRNDEIS